MNRILYNQAVTLCIHLFWDESLSPSCQHHVLTSLSQTPQPPPPELICGFGVRSSTIFCDSWDNPAVNTTNLINTQKLSYFHFIWPQQAAGSYQVSVNRSGIYLGDGVTRLPGSDGRFRMPPHPQPQAPRPVRGLSVWLSANAWHRPRH